MKTTERVIKKKVFTSSVLPKISTEDAALAGVIAWADEHPKSWKIVTTNKSKAFGASSYFYLGWAQGNTSTDAVLERLCRFKEELEGKRFYVPSESFWQWKATFTFEHFGMPGFTGGFFQQWDGEYNRYCTTMDYTSASRKQVIERFRLWCEAGASYPTRAIKLDGEVIWKAR